MKVDRPERPSASLAYDDSDFADLAKVERELRRAGEVCHQCRRCLPLCPSFPKLFELIDATEDEIAGVTMDGFERVNELCYHCKLCYNHCPYTPSTPHEWDIDFPLLMRRHQLARAKRDGVPLARKLTTQTDLLGKVASLAPPLMNFANTNRLSRIAMEKTVGIHRDWVQPSYFFETADRWWKRRGGAKGSGENGRAVLFTTCFVNYSDPVAARSAVAVLEHSGVRVDIAYERCCGMPFTDVGDLDAARRNAEQNVADLLPHVEAGATILSAAENREVLQTYASNNRPQFQGQEGPRANVTMQFQAVPESGYEIMDRAGSRLRVVDFAETTHVDHMLALYDPETHIFMGADHYIQAVLWNPTFERTARWIRRNREVTTLLGVHVRPMSRDEYLAAAQTRRGEARRGRITWDGLRR